MTQDKQKRGRRLAVLAASVVLLAAAANAAVPTRINFQGKLLDTNKNPRNGTYSLTFRICDSPSASCAAPIWTENQPAVSVNNGVFSTQLGSVTPIPASVFSSATRYLEIQIGSEVSSSREMLVTTPYAFKAAVADDLAAGNPNYIQATDTLQSGATFYVSSGTLAGTLTVGGVIVAGTGGTTITTAGGQLDASKLSGAIPSANISGTYSNSLNLSNVSNTLNGDGAGLRNVVAKNLLAGDTNYIQNRLTVQDGSGFYVSSATVGGSFTATGTVSLGGAAGANDVVVRSNLLVGGDIRVNGNDIQDSAGTSRFNLGSNIAVNGILNVPAGTSELQIGCPVRFVGTANGDNFIAYPMTASTAITDRNVLIITGNNTVGTTATAASTLSVGIAVNDAAIGDTVYVAMSGIVTGLVANGAVTLGAMICTATSAGRVDDACNANGAPIGKALTGAAAAGDTIKAVLFQGR